MAIAQIYVEDFEEQEDSDESTVELNPYVELAFPVMGQNLPIDHGYELYSALAHQQSQLHDWQDISINTISGKLNPNKRNEINLTDRSCLLIRLSANKVPFVYSFAGKSFTIGNHKIRLGIPKMDFLQPKSKLRSHIVVIRNYQEPDLLLVVAKERLEKLGIEGKVKLITKQDGTPKRKTIKVKQTLVGFGIEVSNLSEKDSLILQEKGLGGKQKMGCGVFV